MYITAQGPRLRNDLYCVEWDVKPYYTILSPSLMLLFMYSEYTVHPVHRCCSKPDVATVAYAYWCIWLLYSINDWITTKKFFQSLHRLCPRQCTVL